MRWKMEAPCADCPFDTSAAGTHLRKSLAPGRMRSIKLSNQYERIMERLDAIFSNTKGG